jgi:hypothetical protein
LGGLYSIKLADTDPTKQAPTNKQTKNSRNKLDPGLSISDSKRVSLKAFIKFQRKKWKHNKMLTTVGIETALSNQTSKKLSRGLTMDTDKLLQLAKPILEKNDFGVSHTQRVFSIAKEHFPVKPEMQDLTYASIILHDIGGSSIKDQYEKGPQIATQLLKQLNCPDDFIKQVCQIIGTHHDHPEKPSVPFQTLYDSDKLVMFTPQEYPYYNAREGFDWNKIVALIYTEKGQELAKTWLAQREKETTKK